MRSEVSQERLDLKPCRQSVRIVSCSRRLWIDVDMICSRIVHGILVREIDRKFEAMVLSFFLWIGTICAFNQSGGGVPEFIYLWNIIVRMGAILEAIFSGFWQECYLVLILYVISQCLSL